MTKRTKADAFLQAMTPEAQRVAAPPDAPPLHAPSAAADEKAQPQGKPGTRAGLKHIGGYFDRETVEKVAVLRARLGLDNSQLLKLAVDELHKSHEAKRAFGDA